MKVIDRVAIKFIIVGVINTIVGTSVMFFMYNFVHATYFLSSASNYVIGSIVSYTLNKYFTFQSKEKSVKEIIYFILNITICYLLAYGFAKPFVYFILSNATKTIQDNIAMLVGMCLFVLLNYVGQRFFVFKSKGSRALNE